MPAPVSAPNLTPAPVRWTAGAKASLPAGDNNWAHPGTATAMLRGLFGKCPCCGEGKLFQGWLTQVPRCSVCDAPVGSARGDDAPPYFVIFIVAHLVIGAQVLTDGWYNLSVMTEAEIFLPLTLALCLGLLRPVKGATIGLMMQYNIVQPAITEP